MRSQDTWQVVACYYCGVSNEIVGDDHLEQVAPAIVGSSSIVWKCKNRKSCKFRAELSHRHPDIIEKNKP